MLLYGMGHSFLGSETRTVDKSGSQLIYTLYLAPAAPQLCTLLLHPETDTKWPKETSRFTFFCRKKICQLNNHYRLLLSQFLDTMNVGPKGRSGDAQFHP